MVVVESLTKTYRGRPALDGLSLEVPPERIIGLMGSNGSGKTTLLKILAGVLADYDGRAPSGTRVQGSRLLPARRELPGPWPACLGGHRPASAFVRRLRAVELVHLFNLPAVRILKEKSKGIGEKLRVRLAMSRRARVYLLDEPISGVDPAARDIILSGILRDFDPEVLMLISPAALPTSSPSSTPSSFSRMAACCWQATPTTCARTVV